MNIQTPTNTSFSHVVNNVEELLPTLNGNCCLQVVFCPKALEVDKGMFNILSVLTKVGLSMEVRYLVEAEGIYGYTVDGDRLKTQGEYVAALLPRITAQGVSVNIARAFLIWLEEEAYRTAMLSYEKGNFSWVLLRLNVGSGLKWHYDVVSHALIRNLVGDATVYAHPENCISVSAFGVRVDDDSEHPMMQMNTQGLSLHRGSHGWGDEYPDNNVSVHIEPSAPQLHGRAVMIVVQRNEN